MGKDVPELTKSDTGLEIRHLLMRVARPYHRYC